MIIRPPEVDLQMWAIWSSYVQAHYRSYLVFGHGSSAIDRWKKIANLFGRRYTHLDRHGVPEIWDAETRIEAGPHAPPQPYAIMNPGVYQVFLFQSEEDAVAVRLALC